MKNEYHHVLDAVAEIMRPVATGTPPAVTYPRAGGRNMTDE